MRRIAHQPEPPLILLKPLWAAGLVAGVPDPASGVPISDYNSQSSRRDWRARASAGNQFNASDIFWAHESGLGFRPCPRHVENLGVHG